MATAGARNEPRVYHDQVSEIRRRLSSLGLELPAPKPHVANYVGCKQAGDTLFISARVSGQRGKVGENLSLTEGQEAARDALLDILAIVEAEIGSLDHIASIDKMIGLVNSSPDFVKQPKVIDGASDLLIQLWGERGRHAPHRHRGQSATFWCGGPAGADRHRPQRSPDQRRPRPDQRPTPQLLHRPGPP